MSSGFAFFDIIVLAVFAAIILLRLRGTLGKDIGFRADSAAPSEPAPDGKTVEFYRQKARELIEEIKAEEAEEDAALEEAGIADSVREIRKLDPGFTLRKFLSGANIAFEMVLESFAKGKKSILKGVASPSIYRVFSEEIDRRKKGDEHPETTLVSIKSSEVTDAQLKRKKARLTVRFLTEQINLVRNAAGEIIEGDPSNIEEVEDIWTFERDVTSPDPNWTLVATQGA